jgi:hypothetical protein
MSIPYVFLTRRRDPATGLPLSKGSTAARLWHRCTGGGGAAAVDAGFCGEAAAAGADELTAMFALLSSSSASSSLGDLVIVVGILK